MRWNLIEQMRFGFEIFLENRYYIIDHVGTLSVAPGSGRDMTVIWQPALRSSPRSLNELIKSHTLTAIYLLVMRGYIFFMSW